MSECVYGEDVRESCMASLSHSACASCVGGGLHACVCGADYVLRHAWGSVNTRKLESFFLSHHLSVCGWVGGCVSVHMARLD